MADLEPIAVAAAQTGSPDRTPQDFVERSFTEAAEAATAVTDGRIDLLVLPEMFARPFWCVGLNDPAYFDWAEPLDGPTITAAREATRRLGCHAVVPFFEQGSVTGEHFNSAVVIDPDGELVEGVLPDGRRLPAYRKNALSAFNWNGTRNDEKYYFREGDGFPVFPTRIGTLGVLICYDRWFPEGWRVLGLGGADIVCVPNASTGSAADLFVASMRTWAAQNVVYAVGVNRAGKETVGGVSTHYYGRSCVVSPRGRILAGGPDGVPGVIVTEIDVAEVARARLDLTMYRDRRPDIYGPLVTR